ncbi:FecCD family ABC transporter permease [Thalassotalea piscium]|uniref:Iron complex transport system permease protein n=1 Tax=Thalassotalea piscium TaxID=1230533 RepID=A0A7X0TV54_9GAMM|nr:iron ABC transporter permease [Thalassotalea piscium]MBB6544981.1 iron complex transport system permease protein [Thalassotalea piscium]
MKTKLSTLSVSLLLAIMVTLTIVLAMGFGTAEVGFKALGYCLIGECEKSIYSTILIDIRFPRVLMGFLAGFALAAAGALMQNVTRNPLADPYLFGIVAGAGLGATLSGYLPQEYQIFTLPLAAFIGAMLSVGIVMIVLMQSNWRKIEHLLLAGVAVSFLLSAITSFILYFGEAFASNRVIFWLMGSLSRADYSALQWAFPVIAVCLTVALIFSRQLDALLLSDESAKTLGVNVDRLRLLSLVLCAAMTAVIVSYCGGIGFVGLMIPHIVRPFIGLTTAKLLIGAGIVGGCFLIWIDVFARTIVPGQEIPIGVITSVIGSVFFLMLMRKM